MAKMSDWKDNTLTKPVELTSSLVPKFYVSKVPPSASDLSAVAAKETADGWSNAVVDRNSARRIAKHDLYVGPLGLSIGNSPLEDIAPSLAESLGKIKQCRGLRWVGVDSGHQAADKLRFSQMWEQNLGTQDAAVAFTRNMLISDGLTLGSVVLWETDAILDDGAIMVNRVLAEQAEADQDDQYLHVGISVWGAPKVDAGEHRLNAVFRFLKNGSWRGIRALYYCPIYRASMWFTGWGPNPDMTGWTLSRIYADSGFSKYLRLKRPGMIVVDTPKTDYLPSWQAVTDDNWSKVETVEFGVDPTDQVTWWQHGRTLFEEKHDVWYEQVYAIGNPEFVNRFSAVGSWTSERSLAVSALVFDWDGQRLADMTPTMAEADKEQVKSLYISTAITDVGASSACALGDLFVESLYQQNGQTVANEVYKKAQQNGSETLPAMTFAEAITAANKVDTRVWHRQTLSEASAFEVDVVKISGTSDAVTVLSYDGASVVSSDASFGLMCYLNGAWLDTADWRGGMEPDPYRAAWGISKYDIDNNSDKIKIQKEFDEATAYGPGAPLLSKLSGGKRTAMLMGQAAMSRKQFSSFVIGSAILASNARKILL